MMLSRRGLILGIGATLAAPAIVRAESLMHVRALKPPGVVLTAEMMAMIARDIHQGYLDFLIHGQVRPITIKADGLEFVIDPPAPRFDGQAWCLGTLRPC